MVDIPEQNLIGETEAEILAIRQQVAVMGGNDREFGDFDLVLNKLRSGEITPSNALIQARQILGGKNDYH